MFLEFLRIKIGYSFYAVVKYSFQISSVLLYRNGSSMEYFGEMSLILIWNVQYLTPMAGRQQNYLTVRNRTDFFFIFSTLQDP